MRSEEFRSERDDRGIIPPKETENREPVTDEDWELFEEALSPEDRKTLERIIDEVESGKIDPEEYRLLFDDIYARTLIRWREIIRERKKIRLNENDQEEEGGGEESTENTGGGEKKPFLRPLFRGDRAGA